MRGVNVALPAGGTISGRVTSPGGPGLSTVCVESYPVRGDGQEGFATTGSSGRYRCPASRPGRYRVFFDTTADCDTSQDGLVPQWYPDAASRASGHGRDRPGRGHHAGHQRDAPAPTAASRAP